MKAYAQFETANGTVKACNLKGRGVDDIERKATAIAYHLGGGHISPINWTVFFDRFNPGAPWVRVQGGNVNGRLTTDDAYLQRFKLEGGTV